MNTASLQAMGHGPIEIPERRMPGYGRLYAPDPRDTAHPMRALVAKHKPSDSKFWKPGPVTNQGNVPSCVGHAMYGFLTSSPIMQRRMRVLPAPDNIYREAQDIDEWPGTDYSGTSVRAGFRTLMARGLTIEYVWADSMDAVLRYIDQRGPVVVGTDWWSDMTAPREAEGERWLSPTGFYEGGHAWQIYGQSQARKAVRMQNSWGQSWGDHGRAWIKFDALEYLLFQANGEAGSALEAA